MCTFIIDWFSSRYHNLTASPAVPVRMSSSRTPGRCHGCDKPVTGHDGPFGVLRCKEAAARRRGEQAEAEERLDQAARKRETMDQTRKAARDSTFGRARVNPEPKQEKTGPEDNMSEDKVEPDQEDCQENKNEDIHDNDEEMKSKEKEATVEESDEDADRKKAQEVDRADARRKSEEDWGQFMRKQRLLTLAPWGVEGQEVFDIGPQYVEGGSIGYR